MESYLAWLACGSPEAAVRYRRAKQNAALVVTEAKTRVWEEFNEVMERLEDLYQLTRKRKYELKVDLQDFDGVTVYAQYSFSMESETDGYKLHISNFINGGAGDSLATNNGQKFTTFDKDQDSHASGNCAKSYLGGFWYSQCHHANPNGIYLWGRDGTYYAIGNVWQHWKGYDYGLKYISMKIRPVSVAQS
ncbi:microfibril-associated glycoprotein 4-like [Neoarius graeffei]|uniref:microfibril-associated glycoprotein 4-like n=1 Tax=Neoarius graeffei TaxID=443677 RepID=UPI00298CF485|nr:microfibril-associated glycoprotein 4-like [Neoarius graeffei]